MAHHEGRDHAHPLDLRRAGIGAACTSGQSLSACWAPVSRRARLVMEPLDVLMEAVHELHVWTVTPEHTTLQLDGPGTA